VYLTGARLALPLSFEVEEDITVTNIIADASAQSASATFTIAPNARLGAHAVRVSGIGGKSGTMAFVVRSTTRPFDFNGDGKADLLWHNDATGETSMSLMDGTRVLSSSVLLRERSWKVVIT